MKKTLNLGFGRWLQRNFNFVLNISSSLVEIKLNTENQPPNLLSCGDSYEEDLKFGIWKMTSKYFQFFFWIFLLVRLKASCMPKISFLGAMEVVQIFFDEPTDQPTNQPTKWLIEAPCRSLKMDLAFNFFIK